MSATIEEQIDRLDHFTHAYVEAALERQSLTDLVARLDQSALDKMVADCWRFQSENHFALAALGLYSNFPSEKNLTEAGRWFLLARNGAIDPASFGVAKHFTAMQHYFRDAVRPWGVAMLYCAQDGTVLHA